MVAKKSSPSKTVAGSAGVSEKLVAPMADTAEQKQARLDRYSEVVDRALLSGVQLTNLRFEVESQYFSARKDKGAPAAFDVDVVTQNIVFDSALGNAGIFLKCEAGARAGDADLVKCVATYLVAYTNLIGCEEEASHAFLRRVGRFACYPYFRSLVATLDWAANTRLPILPVLKEPKRRATTTDPARQQEGQK